MNRIWQLALQMAYRLALIYWFVFRPTTRGAYVAVWFENQVLIIKNSYKSRSTLPAGGIKRGEDAAEAAIRELAEEVGISLREADLVFAESFVSREEFKEDCSCVFEVRLRELPQVRIDNREVIAAEFVDKADLDSLEFCSIPAQYFQWKRSLHARKGGSPVS